MMQEPPEGSVKSPVGAIRVGATTESMLRNPAVSWPHMRRAAIRADVLIAVLWIALGGASGFVGVLFVGDLIGWFVFALGVLIIVGGSWDLVVALHGFRVSAGVEVVTDKLEKLPGRYYFRQEYFVVPGVCDGVTAREIIQTVDAMHKSPAAQWLTREHLNEVHRTAWGALRSLYGIRAVRQLLREAHGEPEVANTASVLRGRLAEVDRSVLNVLRQLRQCLELVEALAVKLRHDDIRDQMRRQLTDTAHLVDNEEVDALAESTFAYVTAARDVREDGRFPWEVHTDPLAEPDTPDGDGSYREWG